MIDSIVVLTEEPLVEADIRNLMSLRGDSNAHFVVLVPALMHRNMLADFLDNLSLLDFAEAFRDLSEGQPDAGKVTLDADAALSTSLISLEESGLPATGKVTGEDPVAAVVEAVSEHKAQQAVVITTPHAVADTFHQDWANRAQDKLGVPVLHLYSGSGFIGDS